MKRTPRCIFRMVDGSKSDNALYHKEKMEDLVEAALIEEYQKVFGSWNALKHCLISAKMAENQTEKVSQQRFLSVFCSLSARRDAMCS